MEHFLFTRFLYYKHYHGLSTTDSQVGGIRLTIFMTISMCTSVLALTWVIVLLYNHQKNKGHISCLLVVLLLTDILELLLNPYIIIKLLLGSHCGEESTTCHIYACLWSGLRIWGIYLQQIIVLQSVLTRRSPLCSEYFFFPCCYIQVSIFTLIYCLLCEFFDMPVILLFSPTLAMTVTSWVVTCRSQNSHITKKPKLVLMAITTFTAALFLFRVMLYVFPLLDLVVMYECLLSVKLMLDPLLCVQVFREKPSIHVSPTDTDHNAELTELCI